MKKVSQKRTSKISIVKALVLALVVSILPLTSFIRVSAAPIMGRSVLISDSVGGSSAVTYTLTTSELPHVPATAVKSVEIKFCDSLTGTCNTPAGFSALSSILASQPSGLGSATGWTVSAATQGSLRILNASNATTPSGAVSIVWNSVHNPTATNTTFYGIITTYSGSDWTGVLDTGSIALSTATQIQVALAVNETLTFCTGTSITGQNCATASGSLVDLGAGSTTATAKGTSIIAASTNGNTGYSITVNGTTLTSGANTITALTTGGSSLIGSKQFGFNLAGSNATPVVGAAKSGSGTASASANYNINDTFRFATGDVVASASGPTNANTFTVGYIANIDGITPAGAYTTNLTYIATANF